MAFTCALLAFPGIAPALAAQTRAASAEATAAATPATTTAGTAANPLNSDESTLSFAPDAAAKTPAKRGGGVGIWDFIQMILVLGLVVAAIYGVVLFLRKINKGTRKDSAALRVLASTSLGQRSSLHVVQAGSQSFLVGAAENGVNLVAELEDKEFIDNLELEMHMKANEPLPGDFRELLSRFGVKLKGKAAPSGGTGTSAEKEAPSGPSFLERQKNRLGRFGQ